MIRLRNITRTYAMGGGLTVLNDVSLDIERNEYVSILGPSGSGKSTMLHLIGLLDRPTTGRLEFDGQDTRELDDEELSHLRGHRIGFIFQSFHLVSNLSVVENVEMPLFYQHVPRRERRQRAEACLEQVRLSHRLGHHPNQLSGGERQRTAIARALAANPDVILADEPTGNLDSKVGAEIFDIFEGLRAQGKTLVVITHDISVARRIPRAIRIRDGQIVGDGPP